MTLPRALAFSICGCKSDVYSVSTLVCVWRHMVDGDASMMRRYVITIFLFRRTVRASLTLSCA